MKITWFAYSSVKIPTNKIERRKKVEAYYETVFLFKAILYKEIQILFHNIVPT